MAFTSHCDDFAYLAANGHDVGLLTRPSTMVDAGEYHYEGSVFNSISSAPLTINGVATNNLASAGVNWDEETGFDATIALAENGVTWPSEVGGQTYLFESTITLKIDNRSWDDELKNETRWFTYEVVNVQWTMVGITCTSIVFSILEASQPIPLIFSWTHNLNSNALPVGRFKVVIQNATSAHGSYTTVETAYTNNSTYTMVAAPDYVTRKYYKCIVTAQQNSCSGGWGNITTATSDHVMLTDLVPTEAINPTPAHAATNVETEPSILLQWEPGDEDYLPDSYKVYVGGGLWFEDGIPTDVPYLGYSGKIYGPSTTWRVDSIYGETTIEGDEWTFTPSSFFETTYTVPNSPAPIHNSTAGYFNGISCAWKGDSRSTSFELWRGINGAAATLYSTTTLRLSVNIGLTDGQTVIWHVKEQVPSGWIEGPSWSYTVNDANFPGSDGIQGGGTDFSGGAAVAVPTKQIILICCGNKIYYGDI